MINVNNYENKLNQSFMEIYPNAKDSDLSKSDIFYIMQLLRIINTKFLKRYLKKEKF